MEAGVLGKSERPGRGLLYDSPAKLQEALESGILSKYVEAEVFIDPRNVQEMQPEQVLLYFGIEDADDPDYQDPVD